MRPKSPCPRCHHVRCTCATDGLRPKRKAWDDRRRQTKDRRPRYVSSVERKRRRDTVDAWLNANALGMVDGRKWAICPECRQARTQWVADHVHPVALGGQEDGRLVVHCKSCSSRQGGRIGRHRQLG